MGITAQDGFNAWLGYEFFPFLFVGGTVLFGFGLVYLFFNVIPTMKMKARQRRRARLEAAKKESGEKK